jgi:hypothetical protein
MICWLERKEFSGTKEMTASAEKEQNERIYLRALHKRVGHPSIRTGSGSDRVTAELRALSLMV